MEKYFIIIFIFIINSIFGQSSKYRLVNKFKAADTILLVSHELVKGSTEDAVDINGKSIAFPKLAIGNKPNYNVIKERVVLSGKKVDTLVKILERPFKDSIKNQSCFLTHHAIFIIKGGKVSYINLSFECGSFETSKDLEFIEYFDKRRWNEVENFFRQLGFKYYLPSE